MSEERITPLSESGARLYDLQVRMASLIALSEMCFGKGSQDAWPCVMHATYALNAAYIGSVTSGRLVDAAEAAINESFDLLFETWMRVHAHSEAEKAPHLGQYVDSPWLIRCMEKWEECGELYVAREEIQENMDTAFVINFRLGIKYGDYDIG